MDEDITIIDSNTRNEKIKNFFIKNKKLLLIIILIIFIMLVGYLFLDKAKEQNKIKIADQYNSITTNFKLENKEETIIKLKSIIFEKDFTYSPLALYFLIDNNLVDSKDEINGLFDILINKTSLEKEIKNLIVYKKALYNSDFISENELIQMLNPIINSETIWKSHGLYLIAEYFYSKNEKQKAKEFFNQILILPNANPDIKLEAQKKITRELSE
jgi:predicted negative regulator of RcsB-dependent stress response